MDTGRSRLRAATEEAIARRGRGEDFMLSDVANAHGVPLTSLSAAFRRVTGRSFRRERIDEVGRRMEAVVADALARMDRREVFDLSEVLRDHGLDEHSLPGLSVRLKKAGRPFLAYRNDRLAERLLAVEARISETGESFFRACLSLGLDPRAMSKYQARKAREAVAAVAAEG